MEDKQPNQQPEDSDLDAPETVVKAPKSNLEASESLDSPNINNQDNINQDKIRFIPKKIHTKTTK